MCWVNALLSESLILCNLSLFFFFKIYFGFQPYLILFFAFKWYQSSVEEASCLVQDDIM